MTDSFPIRYPRRWAAAIVLFVASTMDLIDGTVVNVALPTIRRDLHASSTQLEWVVAAYMLAFASSLITAGSLGDLYGRRRVFLLGTVAFAIASLGAGAAQTPGELIAARVVQGTAAAAMSPQVLATLRAIFSGDERGMVFGVFGAIMGFASALGLVLGGVLTQADVFGSSWRAIFLINVPIALVALMAAVRVVPETRQPSARRPDVRGAAALTAGLVAIAYALLEGRAQGWAAWIWALLAVGVAVVVGLAIAEARGCSDRFAPLLRPGLLRIPAVSAGLGVQALFSVGLQGFCLVLAIALQVGQHFSPLRAGLTMIAFSVGSFAGAPFAIPLAERRGRRVLVAGAALMIAGGVGTAAGLNRLGGGLGPWPLVPGLVVAGAGLAFLVIPLINVVLAAVPAHAAGGASGLFATSQQLGGAVGVAIVGTAFFGHLPGHGYHQAFAHAIPFVCAAFALSGLLALTLPDSAVSEEEALEGADEEVVFA